MKLNHGGLVEWLEKSQKKPNKHISTINYYDRFKPINDYLNEYVHPYVTKSADAIDGGTLTDHGPEHIKMVISRASELVKSADCELEPYEVYLLLVAIHFHDVGNIFGRKTHEINFRIVMDKLGTLLGRDDIEKKAITDIAQAHGGSIEGEKDKISRLPSRELLLSKPVRFQLLAAILRFADELADERSRASGFLMELAKISPDSEIYHQYAKALSSVATKANEKEVVLGFDMSEAEARARFQKGESQVYLLDEIFERTLKMDLERKYCMRFMRPHHIDIDRIDITIQVFDEKYRDQLAIIPYRLQESGYPESHPGGILKSCPELKGLKYGTPLNGKKLSTWLKSQRTNK